MYPSLPFDPCRLVPLFLFVERRGKGELNPPSLKGGKRSSYLSIPRFFLGPRNPHRPPPPPTEGVGAEAFDRFGTSLFVCARGWLQLPPTSFGPLPPRVPLPRLVDIPAPTTLSTTTVVTSEGASSPDGHAVRMVCGL